MSISHQKDVMVFRRGIVPFVIALIIAAVVMVVGGGYLVATRTPFGRNLAVKVGLGSLVDKSVTGSNEQASGLKTVADVSISAPSFDFSFSPVPALDTAAFNLGAVGAGSTAGAFSGLSFSSDLGVDVNLDVASPQIDAAKMVPRKLAAPAAVMPPVGTTLPAGTTPPTGTPPTGTPPTGTPPTGTPPGATVDAATCAQFASMPSAQYCSAVPDPTGRSICEACKAAGY